MNKMKKVIAVALLDIVIWNMIFWGIYNIIKAI